MGIEIERKFLVVNDTWRALAEAGKLYEQGYLLEAFAMPGWLGEEVTLGARYTNSSLADSPMGLPAAPASEREEQ